MYDSLFRRFHMKVDKTAKNKEFLSQKAFCDKVRSEK